MKNCTFGIQVQGPDYGSDSLTISSNTVTDTDANKYIHLEVAEEIQMASTTTAATDFLLTQIHNPDKFVLATSPAGNTKWRAKSAGT